MHKHVPIITGCGEVLDNFSSKKENKPTSDVLFYVVGDNEGVNPLSSVCPFIGTSSIFLVQKHLKNFLKIFLNSLWKENLLPLYKLLK